jgi:hypothetical protein
MGDLLYVSSAIAQMKSELPEAAEIDVAAGRGLWMDAVRHLPYAGRILPLDSWDDARRLGREGGYDRTILARAKDWMPMGMFRAWTLRARWERVHLIDILARTLGVRLSPERRRPVYFFSESDPEDDPGPARDLGRFAVLALHGFTHAEHNAGAERTLLPLLLSQAGECGHRLVVVGPPGGAALPSFVTDLRGAPIRRVATFVREAVLVVSVLNGITVLADALEKPLLLIALGKDPVELVGPVGTRPVAIVGRPGPQGAGSVDVAAMLRTVESRLAAPPLPGEPA